MKLKSIIISLLLLIFPSILFAQGRDIAKIYKVAILPFLIHSQENLDYLREGINDILTSRISVEGRIIVIDRSLVERALYEERPMRLDEEVAKRIGTRVEADYIVLGSITKIGNYISLDARLISITEEKPPLGVFTQHKGIEDVMVKIGDFAQEIGYKILGRRLMGARPFEGRQPYIIHQRKEMGRIEQEGLGFKKSQTFPFEIKGLDIGDVDGDKKNEVVIISHHELYVFKYDGDKLVLSQKIETGYQHNFLTLDVADVNRNGYAEIIVTSVVEDDLRSFIIEYEEGRFKKVTEKAGWFFRVLEHPKDGPTLIGQRMDYEGLPSGSIYKFVWKRNSFEKGIRMQLPKNTKIFGISIGEIRNEGALDTIILDDLERLNIISQDGKFSWRSRERYGGTNNSYDTKRMKDPFLKPREFPDWRVYIPGRIIIRDLDGDGIKEVIINKNHSESLRLFERIRFFDKGEVHNLIWDGGNLMTNWKTREISGYIADYQIRDVDNDGEEELVLAVVNSIRSGVMGGPGSSNILFFKLF